MQNILDSSSSRLQCDLEPKPGNGRCKRQIAMVGCEYEAVGEQARGSVFVFRSVHKRMYQDLKDGKLRGLHDEWYKLRKMSKRRCDERFCGPLTWTIFSAFKVRVSKDCAYVSDL